MGTTSSSGVPPRVLASGKGKFDVPRLDVEGQPRPSAQANGHLPPLLLFGSAELLVY